MSAPTEASADGASTGAAAASSVAAAAKHALTREHLVHPALNGTNARLDTTNAELAAFKAEVRNELSGLRVDVHAGLDEVRREVHDLRTELREDLGARVRRLEEAVFKRAS